MSGTKKTLVTGTSAPVRSVQEGVGYVTFRHSEEGGAKTLLLVAVVFLLGLGAGAFWVYRSTHQASETAPVSALTEGTRSVLQSLATPVEIRFYSILDTASVSESVKGFAARLDQLLAHYEQEGNGKVKVTRFTSEANADAASADGLRPFNLDKGNACYLGIAVVGPGGKESLPLLSPEWEQAVEPDLSRAIARVENAPTTASKAAVASTKINQTAIDEVKQALPNFASTSLEEGTRVLREAGLKEFKAAAAEMEAQIKTAQENVVQAQAGGSQAEQQAALKNLQQVQLQQADKLKQIAAKSQAQVEALQQLKAGSR